jgi:hypothetical protein
MRDFGGPSEQENLQPSAKPADKRVSVLWRLFYGILLPVILFIICQALLIQSTSGTGSWDGMGIAFGSLVLVPMLFVANFWIVITRFKNIRKLLPAANSIPFFIVVLEYLWLHGKFGIRKALNSAMVGTFWLWTIAVLIFMPLIITVVFRVVGFLKLRKIGNRSQSDL